MGEEALAFMTMGAFFAWQERQAELYELVDGLPLPRRMMSGARRRHDQITVNVIVALGNLLRGGPCPPTTQDTGIAIPAGNMRRPDVGVECGKLRDDAFVANGPRAAIEVLSPSTRPFDQVKKLEEYKTVAALDYILLIDTESPEAMLYTRGETGAWTNAPIRGLDAEIGMPRIGAVLPMREVYDGLTFRPHPLPPEPGEVAKSMGAAPDGVSS